MTEILPPAALRQHIGVVGKTGSGKTSTLKLLVEQAVAEGARVCILDPLKSDWWGLTSSADGKQPGLPFQILGGPHGHVPLHDGAGAAIGKLVAEGTLPLSIIDMADFKAGGLQRFFVAFAETLFRNMRGVVYLVIEEAHEFAPKERAGIGDENAAIHWAKKLATGSRSKGIRLMVGSQRIQALHNAVLGSCETLITHRLTLPADQKPVMDWLKANLDKARAAEVAASLSSLKTGSGWICSGEGGTTRKMQFPRISTFDNSATPDDDAEAQKVITAPVDVTALRAIVGSAVEEAEANDPARLRKEIAALQKQLAQKPAAVSAGDLDEAEARGAEAGYAQGYTDGAVHGWTVAQKRIVDFSQTLQVPAFKAPESPIPAKLEAALKATGAKAAVQKALQQPIGRHLRAAPAPKAAVSTTTGGKVGASQQRILDALAFLLGLGIEQADRTQLAFLADASPKSSGYANNLGALRTAGYIDYPAGGKVCLTDAGIAIATPPEGLDSDADLHRLIQSKVTDPQWRILDALIRAYPSAIGRDDLALDAGASPSSSGYANNLGALRSLGLIDYPARGEVVALPILFLEER